MEGHILKDVKGACGLVWKVNVLLLLLMEKFNLYIMLLKFEAIISLE